MKLKMPTYVDYIRDFLLAIIAIMAGTNIYSYFFSDIYISDSRLVFIDYIVYAIIICIAHIISDTISLRISSQLIVQSVKEKKKIGVIVFIIPMLIELLFDYTIMMFFAFLSPNVMFLTVDSMMWLFVIVKIIEEVVELFISLFIRREKFNGKA